MNDDIWFITERWFKLLEFCLILGTLHFFKEKTGFFLIDVIYWISWLFLTLWFMRAGTSIARRFKFSSHLALMAVWILSIISALLVYEVIHFATVFLTYYQLRS